MREQDGLTLQNEHLRIIILPERGGKIVSLKNRENDSEWLWPRAEGGSGSEGNGIFDAKEAFGFDEMFPNIIPEERKDLPRGAGRLPDHGEIWRKIWQTLGRGEAYAAQTVEGSVLPYKFSRNMRLVENRVHLAYRVENLSARPIPALWTPHPLFSFHEETELLVPEGMKAIRQALAEGPLGPYGTVHPLGPGGAAGVAGALFRPGRLPEGSAFKFYGASPLEEGWCGLKDRRGTLMMRFPVQTVPWLGFWINNGGWGGQQNLALEPATAPMDGPGASEALGVPARWEGDEVRSWELIIEVT